MTSTAKTMKMSPPNEHLPYLWLFCDYPTMSTLKLDCYAHRWIKCRELKIYSWHVCSIKEMLYEVRCLKSNEDMILALSRQFKKLNCPASARIISSFDVCSSCHHNLKYGNWKLLFRRGLHVQYAFFSFTPAARFLMRYFWLVSFSCRVE